MRAYTLSSEQLAAATARTRGYPPGRAKAWLVLPDGRKVVCEKVAARMLRRDPTLAACGCPAVAAAAVDGRFTVTVLRQCLDALADVASGFLKMLDESPDLAAVALEAAGGRPA